MRFCNFYQAYIHLDKKKAIIKAVNIIFPNTKIKLCYFHFSNSIKKSDNNIFNELFNSNKASLQYIFVFNNISFYIDYIYIFCF